jgi:hypothetical protein
MPVCLWHLRRLVIVGYLVDNTGNSSIDLSVLAPPLPTIRNVIVNNSGQVIFGGTNNNGTGGTYTCHMLASTNLALSLTNWTVPTNGSFDASGN